MKHHDPLRPIGKCSGCCLNLRTQCATGLETKRQWRRGKCRHYDDQELLAELEAQPGPTGAALAKTRRQVKAAAMATEPHYNGVLDPGKMAGVAKRTRRGLGVSD